MWHEVRTYTWFWWDARKERDRGVYYRIILKWILKIMEWYGLGLSASEKGHLADCFEHGK
jgi:hypothetical protein